LTGAEKEAQEKGIAEREARGLEINEKRFISLRN
jgi:hypothetical protein